MKTAAPVLALAALLALTALLAVSLLFGCTFSVTDPAKTRSSQLAARNAGVLALTVDVKGAQVLIDGDLYGEIKKAGREQEFILPAGTHELAIRRFGFEDYAARIALAPGGINALSVKMERSPTVPVDIESLMAKPASPQT